MTDLYRVHLCTVAACHQRDGVRGVPGLVHIPGLRDFWKVVLALGLPTGCTWMRPRRDSWRSTSARGACGPWRTSPERPCGEGATMRPVNRDEIGGVPAIGVEARRAETRLAGVRCEVREPGPKRLPFPEMERETPFDGSQPELLGCRPHVGSHRFEHRCEVRHPRRLVGHTAGNNQLMGVVDGTPSFLDDEKATGFYSRHHL